MAAICTTAMAQPRQDEYLGLPGDNLNLYAVMKLFQESETIEGFERNLNDENTRINNLDLNGDNYIDYIKVIDYADGNVHNIVLRVAINKYENQDVATFTVQRFSDGQVQIQLIGDEALYGKNYIIEPYYDRTYAGQTPNPGYSGYTSGNVTIVTTSRIELASWPVIRFIFAPDYVVWRSSWYWGYWPTYWHPWRPFSWNFYYGYHSNWYHNYDRYYHRCDHFRYDHWNNFYSSRRSYSPLVGSRIRNGYYKETYSHPDQRRDGEALYSRSTHDQNRRISPANGHYNSTNNGTGTNTGRRSDDVYSRTYRRGHETTSMYSPERRNSTNTDAVRRSATHVNNGSFKRSTSTDNTGTERRNTNTMNPVKSSRDMTAYNSAGTSRSSGSAYSARTKITGSTAHNSHEMSGNRGNAHNQSSKATVSNDTRRSSGKEKSDHRR